MQARLLAVAAEYFARDGFNRTSVRDVCRAAQANVASIRYYFGSKLGLYRQVLESAAREMIEANPSPVMEAGEPPEQQIRKWVAHLIQLKMCEEFHDGLMCQLISHEMEDASPALADVVELLFAPFHREIEVSIEQLAERKLDPQTLRHLSLMLTCLCFQYAQRGNVLELMEFRMPKDQAEIDSLVDFVTAFFIGGAKAAARVD